VARRHPFGAPDRPRSKLGLDSAPARRTRRCATPASAQTNLDQQHGRHGRERATFADNSVRYEATLRFISGNLAHAQDAMKSPHAGLILMSLFSIFTFAGSGSVRRGQRLNVVASNLPRRHRGRPDGAGLQGSQVTFQTVMMGQAGQPAGRGRRARVDRQRDATPAARARPKHPAADTKAT